MATIKSYTDVNQSKKLAEFLPLKSADMYYPADGVSPRFGVPLYFSSNIPCWTFAALFGILPYCPDLSKHTDGKWYITTYPNDVHTCLMAYDNPIDACVAMIEKLHELNLL